MKWHITFPLHTVQSKSFQKDLTRIRIAKITLYRVSKHHSNNLSRRTELITHVSMVTPTWFPWSLDTTSSSPSSLPALLAPLRLAQHQTSREIDFAVTVESQDIQKTIVFSSTRGSRMQTLHRLHHLTNKMISIFLHRLQLGIQSRKKTDSGRAMQFFD